MNNQDFINLVKDGAIEALNEHGICASMTIAQAILESGWGRYAPRNNLFGIKWQEGCGYSAQSLLTTEYYNGVATKIYDYFRVYDSMSDSVYDHAMFLVNNSRYSNLLGITNYKEACRLIREDGYATDPNYTNLLMEIIEENNLYQYDSIYNKKEEIKKVKNLVVYGNSIDERAAKYLADALQCATIDASLPYDYSVIQEGGVIGVGGTPVTNGVPGWSGYVNKVINGADRYDTCRKVLDFIKSL